jgi:hypothetical protein
MDEVVDLAEWRLRREGAGGPASGGVPAEHGRHEPVARLDRAVQRLHALVNRALDTDGRVESKVETELLAIMGELTVGLVGEAASRAERLADRLAVQKGVR